MFGCNVEDYTESYPVGGWPVLVASPRGIGISTNIQEVEKVNLDSPGKRLGGQLSNM